MSLDGPSIPNGKMPVGVPLEDIGVEAGIADLEAMPLFEYSVTIEMKGNTDMTRSEIITNSLAVLCLVFMVPIFPGNRYF